MKNVIATIAAVITTSSLAFAAPVTSLAGYTLGQECVGEEFTSYTKKVANPEDWKDSIKVEALKATKKVGEHVTVHVNCGIIDNTVYSINLSTNDPETSKAIRNRFEELLGRPHDNEEKYDTKSMNLLGKYYPAQKSLFRNWDLGEGVKGITSTTHTFHKTEGLSSRGGAQLYIDGIQAAEWEFLKTGGAESSGEKEKAAIDSLF